MSEREPTISETTWADLRHTNCGDGCAHNAALARIQAHVEALEGALRRLSTHSSERWSRDFARAALAGEPKNPWGGRITPNPALRGGGPTE